MRQGDLDRARPILDDLEARAAARGDEETRILILWQLGSLEWLAGHWGRALERVSSAHELGEQTQFFHRLGWAGRIKAVLEADLGLVEEARTTAEAGCEFAATSSHEFFAVFSLEALGRLELALGNLEAAGEYLRELPRRHLAGGLNDPTPPVWADGIETLVGLCELERARAYLQPYELHAEGLGSLQGMVGAARCRGLLLAAEGDLSAAESVFEQSLTDAGPFPLERGRTLLCLGTVRRQAMQKRAARESLEGALAIFEELGARLWAEKARAELERISSSADDRRRADGVGAAGRRARDPGSHEQGDRGGAVHGREHGRGAPVARLSQARPALAHRARRPDRLRGGRAKLVDEGAQV